MNKRTFLYFSKEKALPCPVGSALKDKNVLVQDGNNYSLKKVGEIDTQEQIQTHLDGVSLARMIQRFKRGDDSALNVHSGFYGDVSGFSTDAREVIEQTRALSGVLKDIILKDKADAEPATDPVTDPVTEPAPSAAQDVKE